MGEKGEEVRREGRRVRKGRWGREEGGGGEVSEKWETVRGRQGNVGRRDRGERRVRGECEGGGGEKGG